MKAALSAIALIAVAAVMNACGARTGLPYPEPPVDAGMDAHVPCTPGVFALMRAQPTLMFVLDRSGSMNTPFLGNNTRWKVLTGSLELSLPPVDQTMQIGALLFPTNSGFNSCQVANKVDIMPGLGHVDALLALMQGNRPNGSTPTADAIDVAANAVFNVRAAAAARALVLATDGGPNCNSSLDPGKCTCVDMRGCGGRSTQCLDDVRTVARIAAAFAKGLPTYVIGIQNADETQNNMVLDAMADAGGRPKTGTHHFYAATNGAELDAALVAIRDQLGACTYLTTSVPDESGTITVTIDGKPVPYDPSGMTGWHWANRNNGEIVFGGDTCTSLTMMTPKIEAHVTCSDSGTSDASDEASDATVDARDAD
jgi:hypothetical protein